MQLFSIAEAPGRKGQKQVQNKKSEVNFVREIAQGVMTLVTLSRPHQQ